MIERDEQSRRCTTTVVQIGRNCAGLIVHREKHTVLAPGCKIIHLPDLDRDKTIIDLYIFGKSHSSGPQNTTVGRLANQQTRLQRTRKGSTGV